MMDKTILGRLSKLIWGSGFAGFVCLAFPHLWGSLIFLFDGLASLVTGEALSFYAKEHAKKAGLILFPITVLCLMGQMLVLASPSILTGSAALINNYNENEASHVNAVRRRIELASQIEAARTELQNFHIEIQQCRALLHELGRDTKTLTETVALSRKSLTAQITQTNLINDTGDF